MSQPDISMLFQRQIAARFISLHRTTVMHVVKFCFQQIAPDSSFSPVTSPQVPTDITEPTDLTISEEGAQEFPSPTEAQQWINWRESLQNSVICRKLTIVLLVLLASLMIGAIQPHEFIWRDHLCEHERPHRQARRDLVRFTFEVARRVSSPRTSKTPELGRQIEPAAFGAFFRTMISRSMVYHAAPIENVMHTLHMHSLELEPEEVLRIRSDLSPILESIFPASGLRMRLMAAIPAHGEGYSVEHDLKLSNQPISEALGAAGNLKDWFQTHDAEWLAHTAAGLLRREQSSRHVLLYLIFMLYRLYYIFPENLDKDESVDQPEISIKSDYRSYKLLREAASAYADTFELRHWLKDFFPLSEHLLCGPVRESRKMDWMIYWRTMNLRSLQPPEPVVTSQLDWIPHFPCLALTSCCRYTGF